ncbi:MAG TPA: TetR/AcrR family transcriptional regulator [Acidimicrobiales bacterium]|jgi:AcrR family transcriptional regulator|nr:TetR/AcrR family transcriptional regulator [Acidimicrobiales bacterium]
MEAELGLRERKKQQTRQLIAETARRLFVERGFEAVPVADVARAADVSEATVFNYFSTKEDLVFQGMEVFEAELLDAVRDRPVGESILSAFGRFVLQARGLLATKDETAATQLRGVSRLIATSPALQAHQREIFARYTASLAALIAEDTATPLDDLRPWVVAHALIGTHQALINFVHRRLLEGPADQGRLAREVKSQGQRALEVLEQGLGGYGVRTG